MHRIVPFIGASALAIAWISACGGQSSTESNGGDGTSGSGGASGASGTGGTSGTSTGGSGGTEPTNPDCLLQPEPGTCDAAITRYAFNARDRTCREFTYGGCGGNGNNFESIEACMSSCLAPGELDVTSCTEESVCVLSSPGCCGGCEPVARTDLIAVNAQWLDEYRAATCNQGVACGACADYEGAPERPWYGAKCEAGHCVVFDARVAATCTDSSQCRLRNGVGCCEGCGATSAQDLVAISSLETLEAEACSSAETGCPACDPQYPPGAEAVCVEGLCAVDLNSR